MRDFFARPGAPVVLDGLSLSWLRLGVTWLLFACGGNAGAQPAATAATCPEIEYASPDQSVWTTRTDRQGLPDNPLFRVAAQLFGRAGIPWHGRTYPAARMFKYLQDGSVQFSMLVKAPALQECCLLSRKPITAAEVRAYHFPDKAPIGRPEDLVGKSIITVHGYSYGGLLGFIGDERNRIQNNAALTHASAFKMLARGRADYVIDYSGPAGEVLAAEPLRGLQSELLARQDVFLVLSRSYPDAQNVMVRLENIAETLEVDALMRGPGKQLKP
jgi:ABC-type amino acid transport substrate-binding protein